VAPWSMYAIVMLALVPMDPGPTRVVETSIRRLGAAVTAVPA
jgi:hypothetical protein